MDRLVEGAFKPMATLPSAVRTDQLPIAASATLPAGSTIVASDGTVVTLESERLLVSGLLSSSNEEAADTFAYDPRSNTWTTLQKQLSPIKISYAGGTLLATALAACLLACLSRRLFFKFSEKVVDR